MDIFFPSAVWVFQDRFRVVGTTFWFRIVDLLNLGEAKGSEVALTLLKKMYQHAHKNIIQVNDCFLTIYINFSTSFIPYTQICPLLYRCLIILAASKSKFPICASWYFFFPLVHGVLAAVKKCQVSTCSVSQLPRLMLAEFITPKTHAEISFRLVWI